VDVETAKQTGRAAFGEMVAYLKAHPSVRVMLVEKTDRLYRNLKDWVTVDELDVEPGKLAALATRPVAVLLM
jgi:site-specific DNA recombinase